MPFAITSNILINSGESSDVIVTRRKRMLSGAENMHAMRPFPVTDIPQGTSPPTANEVVNQVVLSSEISISLLGEADENERSFVKIEISLSATTRPKSIINESPVMLGDQKNASVISPSITDEALASSNVDVVDAPLLLSATFLKTASVVGFSSESEEEDPPPPPPQDNNEENKRKKDKCFICVPWQSIVYSYLLSLTNKAKYVSFSFSINRVTWLICSWLQLWPSHSRMPLHLETVL